MKPRLYLAGAINGKADEEVFWWRREAARRLGDLYFIVDPAERDFRGIEHTAIHEIVNSDLEQILSCHALLVRAEAPSWGTAMELRFAHDARKRHIVTWGAGDRPSPWLLYHSTFSAHTLDSAIEHLVAVWRPMWEDLNPVGVS